MPKKEYSLYEAKAKLSELIRMVRERKTPITITYHGKAVAEIRPIESEVDDEDPMEKRERELIAMGALIPAEGPFRIRPVANRPGALKEFLEERHRY